MQRFSPSRWRFGLLRLLLAIAGLCGLIAAFSQFGAAGCFHFLAGSGIVLLSWGLIAQRPRFGLLGACLILGTAPYFGGVTRGECEVTRPVQVHVVDAATGEPVRGALVTLHPGDAPARVGVTLGKVSRRTDQQGRAFLPAKFAASRNAGPFHKAGRIWLWEHRVRVECHDFQSCERKLCDFTGKSHDLYGGPLPVVRLELVRGP